MSGTRFGARTQARGQALQLLFQAEATGRLVADVLAGDYVIDDMSSNEEGFSLSRDLDAYGSELALGADGMLHELDRAIDAAATNWSVGRMPSVDRNLLRLAIYEMACVDTVDVAISINEFVELAKAYGTDESSRSSTAFSDVSPRAWPRARMCWLLRRTTRSRTRPLRLRLPKGARASPLPRLRRRKLTLRCPSGRMMRWPRRRLQAMRRPR